MFKFISKEKQIEENMKTDHLNIKIKKTLPNAQMPVKGSEDAAAFDVFAATEVFRPERVGPVFEYDTGLSFEVPPGYGMFILPRSGITTKTTFMLGNGLGLLDPDYRGSLKFQFRNIMPGQGKKYNVGDRIGQILILPIPAIQFQEVEELSETKRGAGGMGSTGV